MAAAIKKIVVIKITVKKTQKAPRNQGLFCFNEAFAFGEYEAEALRLL